MSDFPGARLRGLRELSGMSLADVFAATGVSKSQISKIENGKADPRMSTVTRLLSCYEASLSDLAASPPLGPSLDELKQRAAEAAERLVAAGLGPSDPYKRLAHKAARGIDVTAERESLATRY